MTTLPDVQIINASDITNLQPIPLATHQSPQKITVNGKTYKKLALPFREKLAPDHPQYNSLRTTTDRYGNKYGRMYGYVEVNILGKIEKRID